MKGNYGFTLIELLAVVVVLGIILAIAVPGVTRVIANSKQRAYDENANFIEDSARTYVAKNSEAKSVTVDVLVSEGYLESAPIDPRDDSEMDGMIIFYENTTEYKTGIYDVVLGHNTPELTLGLNPVKWNGSNWVVTTKDDPSWFLYNGDIENTGCSLTEDCDDGLGDFSLDIWANVQVTNSNLAEGTVISEEDLNLYVWIPRYTYKLNGTTAECDNRIDLKDGGENILIRYTNGIDDDNSDDYISHPAFTFGGKELTGIWVSKFEMSADDQSDVDIYGKPSGSDVIVSRPNVPPWRNTTSNDMFLLSREIENTYSLDLDSHMMKNSEWGAVVYLTEAIRDGEGVWMNNQGYYSSSVPDHNYEGIITGCAGSSKSAAETDDYGTSCASGYSYTSGGVKASTTGNVYGIYDMAGGSWEYVASYLYLSSSTYLTSTSYAKAIADSLGQYKDVVQVDTPSSDGDINFTNSIGTTLGWALHEVSISGSGATSWHSDYSAFVESGLPVFRRGGAFNSASAGGIFAYSCIYGGAEENISWHSVLTN